MKNKNLLFVLLWGIFCISLDSSTFIPNGSQVNGEWIESDSPFIIECTMTIAEGDTLIIGEGVLIQGTLSTIYIGGTLIINGTESDSVNFVSYEPYLAWGGFRLTGNSNIECNYTNFGEVPLEPLALSTSLIKDENINNSNIVLEHCSFSGVGDTFYEYDLINCQNSFIELRSCTFTNISGFGNLFDVAFLSMENCIFKDITDSTRLFRATTLNIDKNQFYNLDVDICFEVEGGMLAITNSLLTNITAHYLIKFYNTDGIPIIENNTFSNNESRFISLSNLSNFESIQFTNNIFSNFSESLFYCFNNDGSSFNVELYNCSIYNSEVNGYNINVDTFDCSFSVPYFNNPSNHQGYNEYLPQFDFSLSTNSDCINSGSSNVNFNPVFDINGNIRVVEIIDIGAYEFQGISSIDLELDFNSNFSLSNFPNPFNPFTLISFELSGASLASIKIYNSKGQFVRNLGNVFFDKGVNTLMWNGRNSNNEVVASGIYYYLLEVDHKVELTRKCILLK